MLRKPIQNLIFIVGLAFASAANANAVMAIECFDQASEYHQVNASILRSIAIKETSSCQNVVRRNKNNTLDIGCMQINSDHLDNLSKYGISIDDLHNQCKNIYIAAWVYKRQILKYGDNWKAVGAYHSRTPSKRDAYAKDVYFIWKKHFG